MKPHHRRAHGQSLVLLTLLMLVLIGFVGLSVDVGHAYGQQRRLQNAANAGALGAMNTWLYKQANVGTVTNYKVWANVEKSLAANGIQVKNPDGAYTYRVEYIKQGVAGGTLLAAYPEEIGLAFDSTTKDNAPPKNISRIRVTVRHRLETFFARAVGRNTLTVNANGDACFGHYGLDIYPIGFPMNFTPNDPRDPAKRYHRIYRLVDNGNGVTDAGDTLTEILPSDPYWATSSSGAFGDYELIIRDKLVVYMPIDNWDNSLAGTHVAWLSWENNQSGSDLDESLTPPGNLGANFTEAPTPNNPINYRDDAAYPNDPWDMPHNGTPEEKDWIGGRTGVVGAVSNELEQLLFEKIRLPVYNASGQYGSSAAETAFHWAKTGRVSLVGFRLSSLKGIRAPHASGSPPPKYLLVQYFGDATNGTANSCFSEDE